MPDTRVAAVTAVSETRDRLGEAPYWDRSAGELLRVDLLDGIVRAGDRIVLTTGQRTSFAVPALDGSLVLAQENRIMHSDKTIAELPDLDGRLLLNDAKCDPLGRLWVSTYSPTGDRCAGVYQVQADGSLRQHIGSMIAGNGLAWDESGFMYAVDTADGRIDRYTWHPTTGPSDGRPFVHIDPVDGAPDGIATDTAGGLWVALFGGGAVRRYDPSGALDVHLTLPVSHPTSICFGGEHLDDLFITTSRHRLSPDETDAQPWAGRLLRLRAPHPGVPVRRFGEQP